MSDDRQPDEASDDRRSRAASGRRGPSRFTMLLVGIVIGGVGGVVTPLLLDAGEPNCIKPTSYEWSPTTTTVTADPEISQQDLCEVEIVFREP